MTDVAIINARIVTMDAARPSAQSILIRDGVIHALDAPPSPGAEVIDAGGRLVLPGFQDAHIHLLNGGTDLVESAQLQGCMDTDDLHTALAAHAARRGGDVVWGTGWRSGPFGDETLTRAVLDAVIPNRACVVVDDSGHNACLNSAALARVGITDATPDPQNGHILRDSQGHATGMLHEEAVPWATDRLPQSDDATWADGLIAGQSLANQHGITGVLDPSVLGRHVRTYAEGAAAGRLSLRVAGACRISAADTVDTMLARLLPLRAAHPGPDLHLHSAKFFFDGVLENRTGAMIEPYADAAGGNAPLMFQPDRIAALFTALDAHRFQIHVHCIGDAAVRAALDGFAAARAANGAWPALHQIAHCQMVHHDDLPRFAALGVMANVQPFWASTDPIIPDDTMAMIGPARASLTYPFRSLIDAGAPYCVNSDWSVTTLNPLAIIGTAITREPPRARGRAAPFLPAERMTVMEAVQGYTTHAAAASWRAGYSGALRPGFSGDLIVLDRDIFACDPYAVAETEVLLTLFKGRTVHRAAHFKG